MADRYAGVSDAVVFGKEATFGTEASAYDKDIPYIQRFGWTVDFSTKQIASLGAGVKYVANIDGVKSISGSMEWLVADGKEFEMMLGASTYDSGTGTTTITIADTLPSYSAKAQKDATNALKFLGMKFGGLSLSIAKGEELRASADWMAKSVQEVAEVVSQSTPTSEPYIYTQGELKIGGVAIAGVDTIRIALTRDIEGVRGIENAGSDEIEAIVEKMAKITFSTTVQVTDQDLWSTITNRTDTTIDLTFTAGSKTLTITLTGVRITRYAQEASAEADVRTYDLDGTALDMTITVQG